MFAEERKRKIVEFVEENGRVTVPQLCETFCASSSTIRNDLNELNDRGFLRRTHGGAIAHKQTTFDPQTSEKSGRFLQEKQAVAQAALRFINEGDGIALDAGTSILELAKQLITYTNLRVTTYDLNIAAWLDGNTDLPLYVAGGEMRRGHHYMTGIQTVNGLKNAYFDVFFMAANSIHPEKGIFTPEQNTALVKRQLMANASKIVLLADSSKIGNVSFAKVADISDIDVLIIDEGADSKMLDAFADADVEIVIAKNDA